jgi:cytochrome c oxidase subunit III
MKWRPVHDVSALPHYGFGSRMTTWWGTLGFCVLEGTGFAMAIGACLYLAFLNPQ